jgi:hypothetical protein
VLSVVTAGPPMPPAPIVLVTDAPAPPRSAIL